MSPTIKHLNSIGAILVRQKRHLIWRLPNGKTFTMAKTPSCPLSEKNQQATIKRLMRGAA